MFDDAFAEPCYVRGRRLARFVQALRYDRNLAQEYGEIPCDGADARGDDYERKRHQPDEHHEQCILHLHSVPLCRHLCTVD